MKYIYTVLGFVFTALGALGVILPILPTTPFLLLAVFFFARGSKRFHDWFMQTKLYKNHLEDFVVDRSMTLKTKICTLAFASLMLMFPLIFVDNIYVKGFIVCLIVFKYYYFFARIKTIKD
ncbi:MAG: YbaN family protein [Erysipelotrichaceae bacterium]|nr:YbaN family protein [Erysipelotrichaceae bacterium]